jgi:threonine/homoserine/homoserine lactone efflux protein
MSLVIGPVSMIFIKKTLSMGVRGSVAVASGVALGDAIYSTIAALSITSISGFLAQYDSIMKACSGLFLLYIAYVELKSDVNLNEDAIAGRNFSKIFTKALFLGLSSPLTIGTFIAVFTGIADENVTLAQSFAMAGGLISASILWWIILGSIVLRIKDKISQVWILRLKYVSTAIIAIFGIMIITEALL